MKTIYMSLNGHRRAETSLVLQREVVDSGLLCVTDTARWFRMRRPGTVGGACGCLLVDRQAQRPAILDRHARTEEVIVDERKAVLKKIHSPVSRLV